MDDSYISFYKKYPYFHILNYKKIYFNNQKIDIFLKNKEIFDKDFIIKNDIQDLKFIQKYYNIEHINFYKLNKILYKNKILDTLDETNNNIGNFGKDRKSVV
jgi:hypothetical protein